MRAFVKIRNLIYSYKDLAEKAGKMEREIGRIFEILNKMRQPENDKKEEIGFKGIAVKNLEILPKSNFLKN